MLFNNAANCSDYSVSDEQFWNDNDRGQGLKHEAEHTPPSSVEVKNVWS